MILDASKFVKTMQANIQVLESYKKLPDQLAKLTDKKQDYLEQVLCNVEIVQEVTT